MTQKLFHSWRIIAFSAAILSIGTMLLLARPVVEAAAPLPQNPQNGSVGLEGTISSPPPTRAATITTPVSGRSFTTLPVTVNGLCPQGVMVKLFSNNIFIGSVTCTNGSYSLQVDLFSGQNELIARVFDDLDQAGPDSNIVNVTFNDASFGTFASRVTLSSSFAKKGANPGDALTWPIILSGGVGPYAISIDWGDGKPVTLKSVPFADTLNFDHIYDAAGVYRIIVKATDSLGSTAYLQLIGVANGAVGSSSTNAKDDKSGSTTTVTKTKYSIIPSLLALPLTLSTFWLGRKYELQVLRRRIEASTNSEYNN
ncbi:MAG TPA: hypothetical protein VF575_03000 [Candidatus Saccharimonadales bacterium]|jgi:hypothetical protein